MLRHSTKHIVKEKLKTGLLLESWRLKREKQTQLSYAWEPISKKLTKLILKWKYGRKLVEKLELESFVDDIPFSKHFIDMAK